MGRSSNLQRRLDSIIGIPLVWLAGSLRSPRGMPARPAKIAFLSPTAIGDLILQSGLLEHVHRCLPETALHLIVGRSNAGALPLLSTPHAAAICDFRDAFATRRALAAIGADLLVDLTPWPRLTALQAALSHAFTIGFDSRAQHRSKAFDLAVPHLASRHEVDNLRAMAEVFGPCERLRPALRTDLEAFAFPDSRREWVVFHTGAGGAEQLAKGWPTASWIALARALVERGYGIAFSGTAADTPRVEGIIAGAGADPGATISLCGRLDLCQLARALKTARLTVSIDTGVMHLAWALDAPLVALHGPTLSSRWGPLGTQSKAVDSPHPAAGYVHLGFERHRDSLAIMSALDVALVLEAATQMLDQR